MTLGELSRKIGVKLEYYDWGTHRNPWIGCGLGTNVAVAFDGQTLLKLVGGSGPSRNAARKALVAEIRGTTLEICDGDRQGRSMSTCLCKKHQRVRVPKNLTTR